MTYASFKWLAVGGLALTPLPLAAADFEITGAETTTNGGNVLAAGDSLTVTSTGSLSGGIVGISTTADRLRLTNSGTINVDGPGILATGAANTITNTGTITSAFAPGIVAEGDGTTLSNFGTITADRAGIDIATGAGLTVLNAGTITSQSDDGINLCNCAGDGQTIINTGTITSAGDGIASYGGNGHVVTNSGTINAGVDGIYFDTGDGVVVTNTGTITSGDDGIEVRGNNAVVTHSGTLTATRDGIEIGDAGTTTGGTVTISGRINAGSDAIDINSDNAQVNILSGAEITGSLSIDGNNVTLHFGEGVNGSFARDATDTATGLTVTSASGTVIAAGDTFHVVESTQFGGQTEALALTLGVLQRDADDALPFARRRAAAPGAVGQRPLSWVNYGARIQRGGDQRTTSALLSAGMVFSEDLGAFVALNQTRLSRNSSYKTKARSAIFGLHGTLPAGRLDLGWSLMAGLSDNEYERKVVNTSLASGVELGVASGQSRFVSPALSLSGVMQNGMRAGLALRYTHAATDGYTETGTASPLTVADYTTQIVTLTPTLGWQQSLTGGGVIDMLAGAELNYLGGSDPSLTIAATTASSAQNDQGWSGRAFVRASFAQTFQNGWDMRVRGELGLLSHGGGGDIAVSGVFSRRF